MPLSASIALAVSLALSGSSQVHTFPSAQSVMPQSQTVEEYIRDYFADEPLLAEIARCESRFAQFGKNGQVIKNDHSTAVGVFQIMASIHDDFADQKLGLDIYSLQGNAAYARYLYDKQGSTPWDASKACWSKSQVYKDMQKAADKVAVNKN
jgi:hypothetical protein